MNTPFQDPRIVRLNFSKRNTAVASSPESRARWSLNRWLLFIALILIAHIVAIFIFAERKPTAPHPVTNVPHFQLADNSAEILALENPTLFALPRAGDLASAGLQTPAVEPPQFRWSDSPHLLPLPAQTLGATFHHFMQTNVTQNVPLDFKAQPDLTAPPVSLQPVFATHSALQIEGDLAQLKLTSQITLADWPYADVIAPSRVQMVVNENGDVLSAVLLPLNSPLKNEIHYDAADQRALEIARGLQFAPASQLTVGDVIFNWRTVPPPETNSIAAP